MCFFTEPIEEELSFMEIWENLVSSMPAEVRCDDGRSHTGRPGYSFLDVIAVHAVKLYFKEKTMNAARKRLLSGSSLRTITGISRGPSLAVNSKNTDALIRLIDFNLNLQESPPSKQSERWRGMEERSSDVMRLQYEEMAGWRILV